jgi:hypothetical protein
VPYAQPFSGNRNTKAQLNDDSESGQLNFASGEMGNAMGAAPGLILFRSKQDAPYRWFAVANGNEPTSSEGESGCFLAVELRGDQMDKWCDRTEAIHPGNRTRTARAFATDGYSAGLRKHHFVYGNTVLPLRLRLPDQAAENALDHQFL